MKKNKQILCILALCSYLFAQDHRTEKFLKGPQITFEKDVTQFDQQINVLYGKKITLIPTLSIVNHGFTDRLGIRAMITSVVAMREFHRREKAFGDMFLFLGWHPIKGKTMLMTLLAGLKIPTSSKPLVFLYATQSLDFPFEFQCVHMGKKWYAEESVFINITGVPRKHIKFGNFYNWALAFGPHYKLEKTQSNLFILGRLTGDHIRKAKINGVTNDDSGGTIVLLGPEIAWSTDRVVLRSIIQAPIANRPFGIQDNADFRLFFSARFIF